MDFPGSDDRGQIIVVAALLLAVLFVGLALVLNSAIYAENIATRGDTSTSDAMAVSSVTEERLQQSIYSANYYSDTVDYDDRRSLIRENITSWDGRAGDRGARTGRMYYLDENGMTDGTRVIQRDNEDFLPEDTDLVDKITDVTLDPLGIEDRTTWAPAPNSTVRDFQVTVNRDSLVESEQTILDKLAGLTDEMLTGSSAFWVQTQRTADEDQMWRVYMVNDDANDSVSVILSEIDEGEESLRTVCRAEGDAVTVNLTEGLLVGDDGTTECAELEEAFGGERNHVYFVGADEVSGSYQFMVDVDRGEFQDRVNEAHSDDGLIGGLLSVIDCVFGGCSYEVYQQTPTDNNPYTTTAIYDVQIVTTYRDDRVTYTRNVTYPPAAR